MIRSLMEQQGGARFVQTPLAGATAFGPAGAQARMLERMRERELGRILGGIPANI